MKKKRVYVLPCECVCSSASHCEAGTCFTLTCVRTENARITARKLKSTRNFNGRNCCAPSCGALKVLTNSSTVNRPIVPSQLWNVFMLFTSALGTPLVFVFIWLIFTDKSPLGTVQLSEQRLPLTVYEWSNTLLPTLLRLFVPTLIWLCYVDHFTD